MNDSCRNTLILESQGGSIPKGWSGILCRPDHEEYMCAWTYTCASRNTMYEKAVELSRQVQHDEYVVVYMNGSVIASLKGQVGA